MSHVPDQRRQDDQAARLRELVADAGAVAPAASAASAARVVAVTSGKGGVGKTNVAVNLAICLASRGLKVTLLDIDMGLANADLLLGAHCPYNLAHVASGLREIDQIGEMTAGDVFFIPGASGVDRMANLSDFERRHLIAQLHRLERSCDVLVLDCGAGISRNVVSFILAAETCLLVTTPEPTAVTDAYAVAKVLIQQSYQGSIRLLVNLAESRDEAREVLRRMASVAQRFLKFPIADGGYMLQDTHVELAVRRRCPFVLRYPRCAASACMAAVASRLASSETTARRTGGLFRRVVGLFV
ncbi:MAG: MinD/ParA family protein [Planctomycetota bacterium]|jgi:flagellar biosynthesis protein FlhG